MKLLLLFVSCFAITCSAQQKAGMGKEVENVLRKQVLTEAAWAMQQQPVTVTAQLSTRSAGGKHDFYSEGDYW